MAVVKISLQIDFPCKLFATLYSQFLYLWWYAFSPDNSMLHVSDCLSCSSGTYITLPFIHLKVHFALYSVSPHFVISFIFPSRTKSFRVLFPLFCHILSQELQFFTEGPIWGCSEWKDTCILQDLLQASYQFFNITYFLNIQRIPHYLTKKLMTWLIFIEPKVLLVLPGQMFIFLGL